MILQYRTVWYSSVSPGPGDHSLTGQDALNLHQRITVIEKKKKGSGETEILHKFVRDSTQISS